MSFFRTAAAASPRVLGLRRAGVVALAALALPALGMPSAAATSTTTITLDSSYLEFSVNSRSPLPVGPVGGSSAALSRDPVTAAYGGSITFTVPPQLTIPAGGPSASLELMSRADSSSVTRIYKTGAAAPADQLTVTQVSGRTYRLNVPPDDGVNGPVASLKIGSLTSALPEVVFVNPWSVPLQLSAAGPAAVELPAQVIGTFLPRPASPCSLCDATIVATIPAGQTFQVALPAGTKVSSLGIPGLSTSAFSFTSDETLAAVAGPSTLLPSQPAADGRTASVTFPSGTKAGRYDLVVVIGDGTGKVLAKTTVVVRVTAAQNVGLLSDTGWDGQSVTAVGTRLSPLVPVGLGMMVVAGLAAAAVLVRGRRRRVAED